MILIIGAQAAGKRTYAQSLGYTAEQMADGVLDARPVLYNLQELVAADLLDASSLLSALVKKEVVICNEVGCGVVPLDPAQRAAREACGRLCCELAAQAQRVVRLVCGIPLVIKE